MHLTGFILGYVGGHLLAPLIQSHPDCHVVALVRTEEQAAIIKPAYPKVDTIIDDLDNNDVLKAEASRADAVLSTCTQHQTN